MVPERRSRSIVRQLLDTWTRPTKASRATADLRQLSPENPAFNGEASTMPHMILRLPAVRDRTGLSRSTIYLRISECGFAEPVSLGGRTVGWVEAEINDWLDERIQARRDCTDKTGSGVG